MEELKLTFIDDTPTVKVKITWGIHKELTTYLMTDTRLLTIFTDPDVAEEIVNICLCSRNNYGEVITPFGNAHKLDPNSMVKFLEEIHEYFENFFFQNQQRIAASTKKFQTMQNPQ